ncbi:MAG: hypothetical protein CME62_10960 [Halobacteriovoraceae bacterium]|nr:hypothetical protein [Halobacteriovoraceae bacterium]|tara:strand:- start:800 stop:2356 length:1557 start_codon:yes stop_codon:yes gene_type:complete
MDLKVAFIGADRKYYDKLWSVFEENYSSLKLSQIQIDLAGRSPQEIFIELYDYEVNIIYIDFSFDFKKAFSLAKFINKNNELRKTATVGLFEYNKSPDIIRKALNCEMRLYHYKTFETSDVVFDPVSILDVDIALESEYFSCEELDDLTILQPLRIGYVGVNHFHIETNSYLPVGEILEVDTHPLIEIMPSRKVYISHFSNTDLYYNKRFSYDLEFIYIDNDFFSKTNQNWLLYKKIKADPKSIESIDKVTQKEIQNDMQARKEAFGPTRKKIDLWLEDKKDRVFPKMLKIMLVDHTLDFVREVKGKIEDFPYSLNVQTKLTDHYYQIDRWLPHLIVLKQDEEVNTAEVTQEILEKIKSIKNYKPYVLVFNTQESHTVLNEKKTYDHVLYHPGPVHLPEIRRMAQKLDEKKGVTEVENKIFPKSLDDFSHIFAKKGVKVLKMTESVMFIQSKTDIPMWTLFIMNEPLRLFLTVVPHREGSEFKVEDKIYRCLIHAVGENEKSALRRMINKAIAKNNKD